MDWTRFNTHNESNNKAFEVMCNLLFEAWCKEEYGNRLTYFAFINGSGGDGGVEAYALIDNKEFIAVQSKWFPDIIESSQISQIQKSFDTALKVRPQIVRYIVCIPRDLGSKHVGRGGIITENTEEKRWLDFVKKCNDNHPEVEIELWNETRIQEKLTSPKGQGIYNFWFGDGCISDSQFELSFKKAVNSWAKPKYIPDLYSEGFVHAQVNRFLGSNNLTEQRYKKLVSIVNKFKGLRNAYVDLLDLGIPDKEKEIKTKIQKDIAELTEWISFLEGEERAVKCGNTIKFVRQLSLSCATKDIKESSLHFGKYFHFKEVEVLLENIYEDFYEFQNLFKTPDDNKLIIMGNQGSGKTTAIVSEIASFLEHSSHLPILVNAKELKHGDTWINVIENALGLSTKWSEQDLFCALQGAAAIRSNKGEEYEIIPQCVICVDGIDELHPWDLWKTKIEESRAYKDLFPRIKFVFLTRPYVYKTWYDLDYSSSFSRIPANGDVDPEELCDVYFEKYNIDISKNQWIKKMFRTPMSVRLFCDIYKNCRIDTIDNNTTVITRLFQRKIELLEESFRTRENKSTIDGTVSNVLFSLAPAFTKKDELTLSDIATTISGKDIEELKTVLTFLEEEGFLYSYIRKVDAFSPVETIYSWGMQPASDYLIAQKLYRALNDGEIISVEYTTGIYQMLALIAIEEGGKLLFEYPNITIDETVWFDLLCYVMVNASPKAIAEYRGYVMGLMKNSVAGFREIVNGIIIPVCMIDNHPMGALLLDEYLRSFRKPAERDIWWSIPAYLKENYNANWKSYSEISIQDVIPKKDETFTESPLILAWSLSSVNNETRSDSRMKLLKWGIHDELEFLKLLFYMRDVDDEQLVEDLFAVAYGISLSQNVSDDYLTETSNWIIKNVFSKRGLAKYENSAIRYYGSGIVRIAVSRKLLSKSIIKRIEPPFDYKHNFIPISKEVLREGEMDDVYGPINYDLSRYVLCDHISGFFRQDNNTHKYLGGSDIFLQKYKEKYNLQTITPNGLIIAMTYQYLLNQGWDKKLFWNSENEGYKGVDVSIRWTYHQATHGSVSRVMTVAEKYVWVFRHKIEAVLSDTITYDERITDGDVDYIKDYSELGDYTNTYQEYVVSLNCKKIEKWFHADELAISSNERMEQGLIEQWMKSDELPSFNSWIFDNEGMTLLNTCTTIINDIAGISETVWVSSAAVNSQEFNVFIKCLDKYSASRIDLDTVTRLKAYQGCRCYCTPQEACVVYPEKEKESSLFMEYGDKEIEIKKLVSSCVSSDVFDTERYYDLPSKFVREIAGITYGDGFEYFDKSGKVIASFFDVGESWATQQKSLLIDGKVFDESLKEQGYKPFWVFRIYRSPSSKAYERFDTILHDTDKTYVVWIEGNDIKYKYLESIEYPAIQQLNQSETKGEFERIISEYISLDDSE